MSSGWLDGRVALVTGSARRIGRAIALALAAQGASVCVHSLGDTESASVTAYSVARFGVRSRVILADIADPLGAERLVSEAVAAFGSLDILVNSAAIRRVTPLADLDFAEWRAITSVILDGTFLCCRAAAPHLARGGRGRIVNIGGLTGSTGAGGRAHVAAAKAGVAGLTRALAIELGPKNITVNCVAPGLIEDEEDGAAFQAFRRQHVAVDKIPLGRSGTPGDVGDVVASLCGDSLGYITGQTLHVNGGVYLC